MIKARKAGPTIGCLVIENLSSGGQKLSGLCDYLKELGFGIELFRWNGEADLYGCLMDAFQQVHSRYGSGYIIASGAGIYGAIALCIQLPVERAVLIDIPSEEETENDVGQIRRLRRFVRRNSAFCLADILFVRNMQKELNADMRRTMNRLVNASISQEKLCGTWDKKTCTNDEHIPQSAIYVFLNTGEFAKQLAENPEMCIIYE